MEISLVTDQVLNFKVDSSASNNGGNSRRIDRQSTLKPFINPIPGFQLLNEFPNNEQEPSLEFPNKRAKLEGGDCSKEQSEQLIVEGSVYLGGPDVRIHTRIIPPVEAAFENCFTELENSFGANNLSFNVCVTFFDGTIHEKKELLLHRKFQEKDNKKVPLPHLMFPIVITANQDIFCQAWRDSHIFDGGTISITAVSNEQGMKSVLRNKNAGPAWVTRRLFTESVLTDAVIVTGSGAQIQCHKSFLAVHSPVFRRMFESEMMEGLTGTLKLEQMSEAGVRALLSFLYCWELVEASANCQIALELLLVANEYNIATLEKAVRDLILLKDPQWFTVPFILELLQFAKKKTDNENDDKYEAIQSKALEALKEKPITEVQECPEFLQLFPNGNAGGMELCLLLLST